MSVCSESIVSALLYPRIAHQYFFSNHPSINHPIFKCIWIHKVSSQTPVFSPFHKYNSHFYALNLQTVIIHSRILDNYSRSVMSLNQVFLCVFKSYGNHTAGEVWRVWLHIHCSKVSDPNMQFLCNVQCTMQFYNTETNNSLVLKLISTVSSGSTAKTWSCHPTTPSFSLTSTSILIGTLQMHVSTPAFVVMLVFCTVRLHRLL